MRNDIHPLYSIFQTHIQMARTQLYSYIRYRVLFDLFIYLSRRNNTVRTTVRVLEETRNDSF